MKNNQSISISAVMALAVVVLLSGMVWLSYSRASGVRQSPRQGAAEVSRLLVAQASFYDFGAISIADGLVRYVFRLKNSSSDPITISKVYTSCMCTTASLIQNGKKSGPFGMPGHGIVPRASIVVPAGEEFEVEAVFDPAAHGPAGVGPVERSIYLESSDGMVELQFNALVKP